MNRVNIALDAKVFSKMTGVPTEWTRSLANESRYEKFLKVYGKLDDLNIKNVS